MEDDADEARVICDIFISAGFQVETAQNGPNALQKARELKPDLITMDLMMPKMSGLEVIQKLQADPATRNIPVVVLSCIAKPGMFAGTPLEKGPIVDIVPKPFEMNRLLDSVRRCFESGNTGPARSNTVLVVDDDEETVSLLTSFLGVKGFEVLVAYRAAEAVKLAQLHRPGLILLDLVLPDSDGFKVTDVLKAHPETADIPVIVMTAAKLARIARPGGREGAESYKDLLLREIDWELQRVERSARTQKRRRILIADDEPDLLRSLSEFLGEKGFDVVTAQDGEEALAALRSQPVDAVVLDVRMPKLDGYAVCRTIKADPLYRDVPVIMISVVEDPAFQSRGESAGAEECLQKPVAHDGLLSVIDRWTDPRPGPAHHPLTRLPGVAATEQEMRARLAAKRPFSALFIDLTGFRAYNETYGFRRGDHAIKRLAQVIKDSLAGMGRTEDFIGHYGGDDFVVLTDAAAASDLCRAVIARFDAMRDALYMPAHREKGYLLHHDADGRTRTSPLATVAIGLVHAPETAADVEKIHALGLKLRRSAKQDGRSAYRAFL